MFLIIGLGNPGKEYERTRHNIGFMLIDRLASAHGINLSKSGKACWGAGTISGAEVILLKPLSFMNLSGTVAVGFRQKHSIPIQSILAVYDDCDLPLGRVRLRKNGGSGGHRGVKSLIECLQSPEFARLRLGVGRPDSGGLKDYVLTPFSKPEKSALDDALERGVGAAEAFVTDGIDVAMNRFN